MNKITSIQIWDVYLCKVQPKNFNVRVYGLLIYQNQILISHEHWMGVKLIKFPGGGLEKGEGLADCLRREFMEELAIQVEPADFFYVNDFLQISAFRPEDQLISLYYFVGAPETEIAKIGSIYDGTDFEKDDHRFEWVSLDSIAEVAFTFPIDQVVSRKLTQANLRLT